MVLGWQGDSSKSLGSSPKGSFEHEMLRFMQMNVSGKRRKSRPRSPGQGTPLLSVNAEDSQAASMLQPALTELSAMSTATYMLQGVSMQVIVSQMCWAIITLHGFQSSRPPG